MEIISIGHVDVEKILDPYCRIRGTVVLLNIDRLKILWELMLHDFVRETHGMLLLARRGFGGRRLLAGRHGSGKLGSWRNSRRLTEQDEGQDGKEE